MTTVSTVDPIRVTFGISEQEYMRRAQRINRATYATTQQGPVLHLILDDGTTYGRSRTRRSTPTARWTRAPAP